MNVQITQILNSLDRGDPRGADELLPLVYEELRKLASIRLGNERAGQTIQATGLVHEAFIRLVGPEESIPVEWDGRAHFFGAAAEAMRRILIDRARAKKSLKRGGGGKRLQLDPDLIALDENAAELVALDEALEKLAAVDAQKAELVKLRFFAGLTLRQSASLLGISLSTAERHWAFSRAWLFDALREDFQA